jgi:pyridoxal phosphate enzyme (YggS family)
MSSLEIADNIARVQEKIAVACARVNRNPEDITLVAVSKTKPVEAVLAALEAGLRHFGENRVEESESKIPKVNSLSGTEAIWHMIGHIQGRKAKIVVPLFDIVHSVDSLKIAQKLSELAQATDKILPVLIEVNISGEVAKYGFEISNWKADTEEKAQFWDSFQTMLKLPNLEIRGLMTMAPFYDEKERTRPVFAGLAELREALSSDLTIELADLSMGMSNDYSVAIEEGATIVRIGQAIFGARN